MTTQRGNTDTMIGLRERACLSYWFPKLSASNVNVPRTEIVTTTAELWRILDPSSALVHGHSKLITDLCDTMKRIGGSRCFLRTGQASLKHDWVDSCFVDLADCGGVDIVAGDDVRLRNAVAGHVYTIVEMMGRLTEVWAVQEALPLISSLTSYNHMPVARAFRMFISHDPTTGEANIHCMHPYWTKAAVHKGGPSDPLWRDRYDELFMLTPELLPELYPIAIQVAKRFDGAWSLDLVQHQDGRWFAIDMAPAAISWHWPGCDNEKRWEVEGRCSP